MFKGRQRVGVEFKRADVMRDLKLDALYVVYPGQHRFRLADGIEAVPLLAMLPATGAAQ